MNMPGPQRWKQLSPLLDELFDLDLPNRQGRLAELRNLDAAMADDLEAMLRSAAWAEQSDFLASNAQDGSAVAATLVDEQIGAYVIEALLGQGGTGSVWRARRTDGRFEGAVAIKLLHMSLIGRMGALRFEREGAILARLTHPHIARLLDAGVTSGGQPYLVLELVEGERIDHHCDVHRLNVEQRLALFDDVLSAVAQAHSHLVIHRDIKPTNILVSADGKVKLLDFGIAKLLLSDPEAALVTAEGQRALTPEYAAPEQLQGAPVTTATDVYALGVLLYHLLVGRHPTAFEASSSAEAIKATLETEPVRLTSALSVSGADGTSAIDSVAADRNATLPKLRRQLQGDLENIVARTLRKSATERYQTVAALADDLRRYRAHEPVSARADSLAYRVAKFVRRRRGVVAAGLVIVLAVAVGVAGTLSQARRAEVQAQQAIHERDRAQHELAAAEAMEEFMSFLLASQADKPFTASELLLRGEALAHQQFAADAALHARLLLSLARLTAELQQTDHTMALLHEAEAALKGTRQVALKAAVDCAIAAEFQGEPDAAKAAALFAAALALVAEGADGEDRTTRATCQYLRSARALESGDMNGAVRDGRAALQTLGTPRPGQRMLALGMRTNLAGAVAGTGAVAEGIKELRHVIEELTGLGRGQTLSAATLHGDLGVLLHKAGDALGAAQAYETALKILGNADAGMHLSMHLASQWLTVGRKEEAVALFERTRALAAEHGDSQVLAYGTVDFDHCAAGQTARCDQRLAEAGRILRGFLAPNHPAFGALDVTVGELALARGELQPAHAALLRALAIYDSWPTLRSGRVRAAATLSRIELALGHPDAAATRAAEALAQARLLAKGFAHSRWLGHALVAQGKVQKSRGESVAARASWNAALTELLATVGDSAPATLEARQLLADA